MSLYELSLRWSDLTSSPAIHALPTLCLSLDMQALHLAKHSSDQHRGSNAGWVSSVVISSYLPETHTCSALTAVVDLASSAVWLWEVVSLASGAPSSPARMACAICARPTILLVVSLLSYLNVIRGRVVALGKFDFIVWIPSLVLLGQPKLFGMLLS